MSLIWSFIFLLFTSCAGHRGTQRYHPPKTIHYTETKIERFRGEVFVPEGPGPFPGVVVVHGGGWQTRHFGDMTSIAQSLASHGFVVMNINYRLAPEHRHPAPIEDLDQAIMYFKAHAEKYQLDGKRIGLWGYSSGGHTVATYALLHRADPEKKIQAVVSGGAPYDLTWYPTSPYIKAYLGKYRDSMLEEYFKASPVHMESSGAPPFFLYHAINDKLVEFPQATAFEAKLKRTKVTVERHDIAWWGHANTHIFSDESVMKGVLFLKTHLQSR